MKPDLLDHLACPDCGRELTLARAEQLGAEFVSGDLCCSFCRRIWPIRNGIPRFVQGEASEKAFLTGEAFGREWTEFSEVAAHHKPQFLDWIAPLAAEEFRDKLVLEGGCGKGRHTSVVHDLGARAVVSVDIGPAIDVAKENNKSRPRCHFIQADLTRLPLRPVFEVVFSVGVLHHLEHPQEGASELARLLKPQGSAVFWVYGRENNGWVVHLVTPIREKITSRISHRTLKVTSFLLTLPLFGALRALYRQRWGKRLPYGAYLHYISSFPFREVHSIVYDHLVAPTAHYLTREQAAKLIVESGLELRAIRHHNRQSWTVLGTRRRASSDLQASHTS